MSENGVEYHQVHPFLQRGYTLDGVRLAIFAKCYNGHNTALYCGYYCRQCGAEVIKPYPIRPEPYVWHHLSHVA